MSVLQVKNLAKTFRGPRREIVLKDIHLELRAGDVYCLVGANGCGKTTLLRTLLGIYPADAGEVLFWGSSFGSAAKRRVGYAEERSPDFSFMNALEFLDLSLTLFGYAKSERRERSKTALQEVGLLEASAKRLGAYSRGMERRLALAELLSHDPELMILDEPLEGLDFEGLVIFQKIVNRFRAEGRSVMLTTHLYAQMKDFATRIGVLYKGRIREQDVARFEGLGQALARIAAEEEKGGRA